jgi:hypothetical protein
MRPLAIRTAPQDACKRTTELVLDGFMNGFIHQLYLRKWSLYARRIHYLRCLLDFLLTAACVVQTFIVKNDPTMIEAVRPVAVLNLCLVGLGLEEEIRIAILYARNEQGEGDARIACRSMLWQVLRFCASHGVHLQALAYIFSAAGSILLLSGALPDPDGLPSNTEWFVGGDSSNASRSGASVRRQLGRGGGGGGAPSASDIATYSSWPVVDEEAWSSLWLIEGIALLLLMLHTATTFFMPFENIYILLCTISKMLRRDMATFMALFLWFLVASYFGMYTLYPRSGGNSLPHVSSFNNWYIAFFALTDLSFLGEKIAFTFFETSWEHMGSTQLLCLFLWLALYYMFLIISLILMINLLIAMMSHTFDAAREEAVLQSRLGFASCIMKLELIANSLRISTRVGERTPTGDYVYKFRAYERREDDESEDEDGYEGDFDEGGSDPFAPPVASMTARMFLFVRELREELLSAIDPKVAAAAAAEAVAAEAAAKAINEDVLARRERRSSMRRSSTNLPGSMLPRESANSPADATS